jgi:tryptophan 2,3-dioxygenase
MSSNQAAGTSDADGIHWDPGLSYSGYLELEPLLRLQRPSTGAHDESMFIIIHQASELWMKLIIFELGAAMRQLEDGRSTARSSSSAATRTRR